MKDVKLVATDMDHTLLTEKGELPPHFAQTIAELKTVGVDFAIASGRPLYTLLDLFADLKAQLVFISDNGGAIHYKGDLIFTSLLAAEKYQQMIAFAEQHTDGVAILCGLDSAYIANKHRQHETFLSRFYSQITFVDDLQTITTAANKFTVYFPDGTSQENYATVFAPTFGKDFSVTVGDTIWLDIMNQGIDKGQALRLLGEKLTISDQQMMAFGDTYNDVEMLQAVKYSYLVANAAEDMKQYANYTTKSNDDYGVSHILDQLIVTKRQAQYYRKEEHNETIRL